MIVVCGESLIDLTPTGAGTYAARPGGSPFNTAVALGRLGVPTGFLGRMSTDVFGRLLRGALGSAGVDTRFVATTDDPSSLAVVTLSEHGNADYTFYLEGTADRGLIEPDVPAELPAEVRAIHFGSLSMVLEPGASTFEALMRREHEHRLLTLDPNCRPAITPDREAYRARLETWLRWTSVVKVSADDLAWLYPGVEHDDVAEVWLQTGPVLVVVTHGGRGATGYRRVGHVHVAAPVVQVADTIGAGDTFNAGLLAWFHEHDLIETAAIEHASDATIEGGLTLAAHAASITCSRPGADPPWRSELVELGDG